VHLVQPECEHDFVDHHASFTDRVQRAVIRFHEPAKTK